MRSVGSGLLHSLVLTAVLAALLSAAGCQIGYGNCPPGSACWNNAKAQQHAMQGNR